MINNINNTLYILHKEKKIYFLQLLGKIFSLQQDYLFKYNP